MPSAAAANTGVFSGATRSIAYFSLHMRSRNLVSIMLSLSHGIDIYDLDSSIRFDS
jgi:hypothetical protein